MVNNGSYRKLVTGECKVRITANGRTQISNGPVYDLDQAKLLLRANGLRVVNDQAELHQKIAFQPEMTDEELKAFVLALTSDDYDASERCSTSIGMTLDTDGYAMKWNRNRCCRWEYGRNIYVKFGFSQFGSSPKFLVISIHPAKR